ncbi:MAG: phosphatidate cytidylyltransferase [Rhizobiaceae bacterium]|nr:phosphatidate cytidylyltransferase [Rhizobiaceae bacterium]
MSANASPEPFLNRELKLRIVSAIVLAVIVLFMTWIGGPTFQLLWAVAALLIFNEYSNITKTAMPAFPKLAGIGFLLLVIAAYLGGQLLGAEIILLIGFVLLALWEWISAKSIFAAIGLAYAGLPFIAMSELRLDTLSGLLLVIIVFACVWGADVFAYFSGRSIGGPKLAPRISPKKTWAGFIGGILGSVLLSWAVVAYAGKAPGPGFFALIVVVAVASQVGDLAESVLKRKFDVKDSGTLIPGHGGVLDRVDGLIFSSVLLWFVLYIMQWNSSFDNAIPVIFDNVFLSP